MQRMQAAQTILYSYMLYSYLTDGSQTMISFISGKIGQMMSPNTVLQLK
jgi:hypothetical protein